MPPELPARPPRPRSVIVSVHDVAQSTLDDVRWLLARLDDVGAVPRVLKVIPAEAGQPSLAGHDELLGLLQAEASAGSEIVLHGYEHRTVGPVRGPGGQRVRARLFAPNDAEFLSVGRREAARRVEAGRDTLSGLGLPVRGFCAPGWISGPELPGILAGLGFRYLVGFTGLLDLDRGHRRSIPAFGSMGAGPLQERLIDVERALVLSAERAFPVLRAFVHPARARSSSSCSRTLKAIEFFVARRQVVTYGELLGD